jgi:Zn-dependent protease
MDILIILCISISAIAVSVILHEVTHGYVAKYLGDTTAEEEGRLTLNPIVHIHPIYTLALPMFLALIGQPIFGAAKPVPVQGHRLRGEEFGMALVGVSGPLVNLLLAIIGGIIFSFSSISNDIWDLWWKYFIQVNIGFFLFNLLPIPPLDGSRVLYAFAPEPLQNVMNQLENVGIILIFALIFFGGTFFATLLGAPYEALYTTLTTLGS